MWLPSIIEAILETLISKLLNGRIITKMIKKGNKILQIFYKPIVIQSQLIIMGSLVSKIKQQTSMLLGNKALIDKAWRKEIKISFQIALELKLV